MSYMAGVLYETETAYPSRAPGSPPGFGGFPVAHPYSFLCCVVSVLFLFCFVCLLPGSCVPNVASVFGFSILDCAFGFL